MANARRAKVNDGAVVRAVISDLSRSKEASDRIAGRCLQHIAVARQILEGLLPHSDQVVDRAIAAWLLLDPRNGP